MSAVAALGSRPEPPRDRGGRYLIDGHAYTRATTIAKTLDDLNNLMRWQQRMTAIGLVARRDLFARVAATDSDDKKQLDRLCEEAFEAAKGSAGANLGTALHTFCERADIGDLTPVPAPWDADVAAYRAALDSAGITVAAEHVERVVLCSELSVAGTFDRILRLPDGRFVIGDLKTGGYLGWQAFAVQLAIYAHADHIYDAVNDRLEPMPTVDQDTAVIIHLPAGQATCTLYELDIRDGWGWARTACELRAWRTRKNLGRPLTTTGPSRRDRLVARLEQLREHHPAAFEALAATWPTGVRTFRASQAQTVGELDRIEAAIVAVEARFSVPFPDTDTPVEPHPIVAAARAATTIPDSPPERLPRDVRVARVDRLRALPDWLFPTVERYLLDAGIPNLHSPHLTVEHLELVDTVCAVSEEIAVRLPSGIDVDDVTMRAAVWAWATGDLNGVLDAARRLASGDLVLVADGDTWAVQPNPNQTKASNE